MNPHPHDNPARASTTETHVAPLLPATAPAPEPRRRVNFLEALLLFWLMPKRYGPHLAVASIWRALAAHGLALLGVLGVVLIGHCAGDFMEFLETHEGYPSLLDIRIAAAYYVLRQAAQSPGNPWSRSEMLTATATIAAIQLAVLALAVLAMPWCAGGDRAGSVFKRSLKNVYWSTTLFATAAIAIGVFIILNENYSSWFAGLPDMIVIAIVICLLPVPVILFLRTLIVGASRYVGEPDGPAFSPREPTCDQCGYLIIGLPLETNCPECGTPVRDSLPGGRRQPTAWQQHELRPRGVLELVRIHRRVLRGTDFFRELPVHQGLDAARHFWWVTFLLMVVAVLAPARVVYTLLDIDTLAFGIAWLAVLAVTVPFLAQAAMMFAGCLWAQLNYGIGDYRISAIVCYYATPLMLPLMTVLLMASVFVMTPPGLDLLEANNIRFLGLRFDGWVVVVFLVGLLAIPGLGFWWRRLLKALAAVRYANV